MLRLSRLALLLLSVLMLAHALPRYLDKAFASDYQSTLVGYSAVMDRFVLSQVRGGHWSWRDEDGRAMTQEQVRLAMPFEHLDILQRTGRLPGEVAGWPMDPEEARRLSSRMRLTPRALDRPDPGLYSLLESEPGPEGLRTPPDLFRMGATGMEFIIAATNRVDADKSGRFSAALARAGFELPARMVADAPGTLKPYDNGVLLVDRDGRLFHLWQVRGRPRVERTGTRIPGHALSLHVFSQPRREYHGAYLLPDAVVLLDWKDHAPQAVPLEGCDFTRQGFAADGDVLNWNFSCQAGNRGPRQTVATDRELRVLRRHHWEPGSEDRRKQALHAGVMGALFPFQLQSSSPDRTQVGLRLRPSQAHPLVTLGGILAAMLAYVAWHRWRRRRLPRWPDLALVAVTGWSGAIALAALGPLHAPRPAVGQG